MLLPIATLLAYMGSDSRHERGLRERALALLKHFDNKCCLALGLSADLGLVCQAFLRCFDNGNHDIALSRTEIDDFIMTLEALFLEGRVFTRAHETAPAAGGTVALPAVGGRAGKFGREGRVHNTGCGQKAASALRFSL